MFGMKLGPESNCFIHLNLKKGNMINPLHRRGEKPCSSKTQLKETVQKKPKPMMSTKFQVHGKIISDFCSVDGTKWRRIPGGIINTIFEEWNWNEDETSSMKKVDQSSISKPLPPRCTYNHLNWRVVYFAILNVPFNILLFQLKDVTQPMPIFEGSQGDLSRGDPDDPS